MLSLLGFIFPNFISHFKLGKALVGASELDIPPVLSNISNIASQTGRTGTININAPSISILDGATITNIVTGNAKGGDITINADEIKISGTDNVSGISASSISSNSSGLSEGANVYINAANLQIEEGATIISFSFDTGELGNTNINVSNSIKIDGSASRTQNPSSIVSTVVLADEQFRELFDEIDIDLSDSAIGNSGSITINTPELNISNNGLISVLNQGTGNGGNLQINADRISINPAGSISASTLSGEGGNISLNSQNLELLDQSQITASAGGEGNGGNVTINSNTLLGVQNSDITANAVGGDGGNITINSDFVVGLESRSQLTSNSDITATSEFGIDGTVTVNAPDNNLDKDVFAAFRNYATPQTRKLLERKCLNPRNPKGKLLYVGRFGVPASPDNFFDDEEIVAVDSLDELSQSENSEQPIWIEGDPIIDSNAVKVGKDGEVYLVAERDLEDAELQVCRATSTKESKQ